ncbi:MAG: DUF302 domain-containing protein [Rhodospirillaceae bacterium]|jgi:uncharacterized protein (DUF302 family)|nr:DUF302 domain-containing protein [Rhodospirillaceae bacterium]MBT4939996.1 DUF302 domain-containing protein [Rhodospirillaceae bacterium]MBT5940260.1 DUF302 domain-containing protein [Rhodospirillaceae bacterium]MBT7267162.1 DUF302 domain-containing protein [Rhodospirillaceae bacterium]
MTYHFTKQVDTDFDGAIERATEVLSQKGFGVLTRIDVKETLKKKIDVDFKPYTILGACNPKFAHQALTAESKIGVMLPCNVIVEQADENTIEVTAVDPMASMQAIENPELGEIAQQVQSLLKDVIAEI